ncbi:membrane protein insertion efficiency factor YidD [Desulfospira joergensenii]|uniref:membrane protein insertion efficiency factor YidD n=1 Tax=Desulfospira joergensenii TaxID=53329 RepID=UPI0003B3D031|nr:membrane protein insertion efficiency factor YidD [Desulfospira joergensenii]
MNKKTKNTRIRINILLMGLLMSAAPASADNLFIRFYQEHISPIDGARCPMHPTCSEYAGKAIQKHGPVLGWIMACDRLVRCGRDEVRLSRHVWVRGETKVFDPVENNDFWWFKEKKSP